MPEPLDLPEAIGWVGGPLADLEGETLGEVQSVYIDSTSHRPAWLVAKLNGEVASWARSVRFSAS